MREVWRRERRKIRPLEKEVEGGGQGVGWGDTREALMPAGTPGSPLEEL